MLRHLENPFEVLIFTEVEKNSFDLKTDVYF